MNWGVSELTVTFGDTVALDRVSLNAPSGRVTGVVGGDGAGKTTLLRCLAGVVKPAAGEVRSPPRERMGYLSAKSGTYPDLSVEENLSFSAQAYGMPTAEARVRTEELLQRTGLAYARARLAGQLSGGMRQKLGVVRAMLHRPELLVLDEPTTGIDPVSRADLWWLIARAAAEGAAVVLTTAYLDEAERASWLLALDDGQTLAQGTPEDIASSVKGTIHRADQRPTADVATRSWRRAATWRIWTPPATEAMTMPAPDPAQWELVRPDLTDAVTVAALAREAAGHGGRRPA